MASSIFINQGGETTVPIVAPSGTFDSIIMDRTNLDLTLSRFGAGGLQVAGTTPRVAFGGATSSFPMLKRSSAILQCRLADDSADAEFACNNLTVAAGGALIGTSRGRITFSSDGQITFRNEANSASSIWTANGDLQMGASSSFRMTANGDGIVVFRNTGATDFNRIQLGGTSSSFPSIKRSSTTVQIRLADDSTFAPFTASAYNVGATAGASFSGAVTNITVVNGIVTAAS